MAIYRAAQAEKAKLEARGCVVERIRIHAEMKRDIARDTASRAAALERRRVARELGLPVAKGKVLVPDAQIQYRDPDGRAGRVNIEVVSEHYSDASIAAKAAAGSGSRSGGARGGGRAKGTIEL